MPVEALITRDGPVNAPLDYNVPAASELIPLVISATFADPTNAGPYVPVVEVVTPQGVIIGPFPLAQSIAVGASARVSWFRGLAGSPTLSPNTGGTWIAYTPTWTSKVAPNPSIGNGTIAGVYYQLGKFVVCRVQINPGSTTTFGSTDPTNVWQYGLPVPAASNSISFGFASNSFDTSAGADIHTWGFQTSTSTFAGYGAAPTDPTFIAFLAPNGPVTWASGDRIVVSCLFEAA